MWTSTNGQSIWSMARWRWRSSTAWSKERSSSKSKARPIAPRWSKARTIWPERGSSPLLPYFCAHRRPERNPTPGSPSTAKLVPFFAATDSQVVTDRNLDSAAGLHDGQNRRHLRPGLLAAYMDPVFPAQRDRAHRVLREVGTQLQLGVLQEAGELPPLQECVDRRLPQRTRRQGSVAGCLEFSADGLHQWLGALQAPQVACGMVELVLTRQGVDPEQVIDQFHDASGDCILGVELDRIEEFPPGVRPASGVHQLRPAHLLIGDIAVGLQNAFELSQELLRPFASAPHAEVKDDSASRSAVLPKIGLMILSSPIM